MKSISLEEYNKIKDKVRTIDVRTKEENNMLKRFPWAENIYVTDLVDNIDLYCKDKSETIITVCNSGNRSSYAADILNQNGFDNAYVLDGGIYGYYRVFKN